MKLLTLMILGCALYAEDAGAPEPQITIEEQRDWQRMRAEMVEAKALSDAATKAYQDKTNELIKKCGDRPLVKNAQGDPSCALPEKK